MTDERLIVALDVPNAVEGLSLAQRLGNSVSFYKIGLGMLTGGGLGLANELKQEHGKRIFLDMKLFDISATVESAVRGLAQFDIDFLTVHGDPHVVAAAKEGAELVSEAGFSPARFLTNWNNLSTEAKQALFNGTEYKDLVPALDDLVFTIDRVGTGSSFVGPVTRKRYLSSR